MNVDENKCPICLKNEYLEKDFIWMKSKKCEHRMYKTQLSVLYGFRCKNCLKKSLKLSSNLKCPTCKVDLRENDFQRESQTENEIQKDKKYREEILKEYRNF